MGWGESEGLDYKFQERRSSKLKLRGNDFVVMT